MFALPAPGVLAVVLCSALSTGCPQKTTSEPTPAAGALPSGGAQGQASAPPVVVAPQPGAEPDRVVPPQPKPKNVGEAWDTAATKQTHWRSGLVKACKQEAERAALLKPFAKPSAELVRLIAFARAFPAYDPGLGHTGRLDQRLKRLYREESFLTSLPFKPESDAAGGLLLLADAKVMGQIRFVLTAQGWQSPRQGLGDGSFPNARAQSLLNGIELARDGRWPEATTLLSRALRVEGARASETSGDAEVQRTWGTLSALLDDPSADYARFSAALEAWTRAFGRKDLKGPAALNKKG